MATPLANYQTVYQMASDQLVMYQAALFSSTDDVQSYSIEGQQITRKDLLARIESLMARQEQLLRLISMEGGPYEVQSFGVPI
jgi:hypothetical protein